MSIGDFEKWKFFPERESASENGNPFFFHVGAPGFMKSTAEIPPVDQSPAFEVFFKDAMEHGTAAASAVTEKEIPAQRVVFYTAGRKSRIGCAGRNLAHENTGS